MISFFLLFWKQTLFLTVGRSCAEERKRRHLIVDESEQIKKNKRSTNMHSQWGSPSSLSNFHQTAWDSLSRAHFHHIKMQDLFFTLQIFSLQYSRLYKSTLQNIKVPITATDCNRRRRDVRTRGARPIPTFETKISVCSEPSEERWQPTVIGKIAQLQQIGSQRCSDWH